VYPNPATNQITIDLGSNANSKVAIYNVLGQQFYASEIEKAAQIDVSAFQTGTYVIKISSENGSQVLRFVKQ
tara:strand:- start:915 stop:1130 length:216 start_codon:yes stop_codon:yes gene_type:complete